MLTSDVALLKDPIFLDYVKLYASNMTALTEMFASGEWGGGGTRGSGGGEIGGEREEGEIGGGWGKEGNLGEGGREEWDIGGGGQEEGEIVERGEVGGGGGAER